MGKQLSNEDRALLNARKNAVDSAWRYERTLVFMGRGTRDWTPKQQRELIETGRISGFQGHHMSSVKEDPKNAGNRDNIQFLTDQEHLAAHGGNFQNATSGKYDPKSGIMTLFENQEIEPMEELELSDPIYEYVDLDQIMREVNMEEYSEKVDALLAEHKELLEKSTILSDDEKASLSAEMDAKAEKMKADYKVSLGLSEESAEISKGEDAETKDLVSKGEEEHGSIEAASTPSTSDQNNSSEENDSGSSTDLDDGMEE